MSLYDHFLAELEQEAIATRQFLANIPADQLDWQPHPKSLTIGQLGLHIASAPSAILNMLSEDRFEVPDFNKGPRENPESLQHIQDAFEQSVADFKAAAATLSDEYLSSTWTIVTADDQDMLALPRYAAIRSLLFNHLYHHRGQLGVFLRLIGATVPSAYGPSGDQLPEWAEQHAAQ
ncbi:DinB family protein [Poriferisphaera corsica]|uniref:DinB family protein n=1 Tax=Poriferisphaera corsica TaxID=2528020 RepID=A0A517YPJ7_9BACT|nr:DinB family protein [Poriferisphaera corsica]QDU32147.1 DinB family protein [Poriferisphaera corsica]